MCNIKNVSGESNSRSSPRVVIAFWRATDRDSRRPDLSNTEPGIRVDRPASSGCTGHGRGSPGSWSGASNRFATSEKLDTSPPPRFPSTGNIRTLRRSTLAIIQRDDREFLDWRAGFGHRAPWNHPGKIIPPPECLTTMTLRPRGNAYRNKARQVFKCGNRWVSDVADLQRECVCVA